MQQKPEAFVIAVFLKCITSGRTLKCEILSISSITVIEKNSRKDALSFTHFPKKSFPKNLFK